jgi:cytochrome c-type biogenesis protein CcmH
MAKLIIVMCCFLVSLTFAGVRYEFSDKRQEAQFSHLTQELRCMVCSHQSLAESNAPFAMDMKSLIAEKIRHGESDKDIMNFLSERYGDMILFNPPFKYLTLMLWLGPVLFLLLGFFMFRAYLKGSKP